MPRNRVRTQRGRYEIEVLNKAVQKVRSGEMSKRKAKIAFGVSRKTFIRHLKNAVSKPGSLGRFHSIISKLENALANHNSRG